MKISMYAPCAKSRFETARQHSFLHSERIVGNPETEPLAKLLRRRLSEIARECGLSVSHFARSFKTSFGTPTQAAGCFRLVLMRDGISPSAGGENAS
jgi:AraC-like DNA-binding protein